MPAPEPARQRRKNRSGWPVVRETRIMAALMVSETELVRLRVGIGGLLEYHPAAANENTRECQDGWRQP
jgi:hypothetical protein